MEKESGQLKVLKGSQLIDAKGGQPLKNAVVVIEGARIREIGTEKEVTVPKGAEIIDLPGCTLLPGLMDIHLHLSAHNTLTYKNYRVSTFEATPQMQMLTTLLHAQMMFEMGFTTLRDHPWVTMYGGHNTTELVAIRDAINTGFFARTWTSSFPGRHKGSRDSRPTGRGSCANSPGRNSESAVILSRPAPPGEGGRTRKPPMSGT
jgi:hypothetical protein